MQEFQNSKDRPYIHLVDGGVADNIGMRAVLETFEELAASAAFRGEVGFGVIRRIVLIVVNARSAPRTDWDRSESPPGTVAQLLQASGVPIDRYSFETVETMKDRQEIYAWRRELLIARARLAGATEAQAEASVPLPKLTLHVMDVSFDEIRRPEGARLLHEPAHELRAAGRGRRPAARRRRRNCCANRRTSSRSCASSAVRRRSSAATPTARSSLVRTSARPATGTAATSRSGQGHRSRT